jgi:ATP:ADP antiporter, AAA family
MAITKKFLNLETNELKLVILLGVLLLGNAIAMQVSSIVSISGFLFTGGVNQILIVLMIDYALVLVAGSLHTLIVDKFDRIKLMSWMSIGFGLVFLFLRLMFFAHTPGWLNYSFMYLIAEQQLIFFPMIFWVLANDVFSIAQSKRLFPLISSFVFVGKLIGIGIAFIAPTVFSVLALNPDDVLFLNVLIYLVLYLIILFGMRKIKTRKMTQQVESLKDTLNEGWEFMRDVALFRYLMIAIIALAFVDTIIEFRFLVVTDIAYPEQALYQQFYSLYRMGATILSLLVQVFLTSKLVQWIGLKNAFIVFPIVGLLGAGSLLGLPGAAVAIATMVMVKLIRETIDDSSRKSVAGLVPEERRGRVSAFMASYLPSLGTIGACIITWLIVQMSAAINIKSEYIYLPFAILGASVALWSVIRLRTVYDSSLLNWRLKRRQRVRSSALDKIEF